MVEVRIQFRGPEDRSAARALEAAGLGYDRLRKPGLTGIEVVTLVLSVASIVVPTVTQILLELRDKNPNITVYIDGRQQTVVSAEQLTLLLQGREGSDE